MWELLERRDNDQEVAENALTFIMGAAGGFAVGLLLSGRLRPQRVRAAGTRLGRRARNVASRLRPGRLRRAVREQTELTHLEDAVLDAFLADELLSERGIDVGAISRGIIELSGSVWTRDEAQYAVEVARGLPGVETVVNRMDVDDESRRLRRREPDEPTEDIAPGTEWTGLNIGMGRRRQGKETDPDRPDESQDIRKDALEDTDRDQFEELGYAANPRQAARPEDLREGNVPDYREDELDNQSPYGKHARSIPEQPQARNTHARVGEGSKPGVELNLEAADVPAKPHAKEKPDEAQEGRMP